jgi:CheY-like chemotaxis protein
MKGFSILVIDDDADTLSMLKWALRTEGYDVVISSNAAMALRLLESWKPDLVVTDIAMPGLDGISLIRRVKNQPALADVPVLVVSAYTEEQGEQALEAGAILVLPKPQDLKELLQIILKISMQAQEQGSQAKARRVADGGSFS